GRGAADRGAGGGLRAARGPPRARRACRRDVSGPRRRGDGGGGALPVQEQGHAGRGPKGHRTGGEDRGGGADGLAARGETRTRRATLALADGTTFEGHAFGSTGETVGEVVFNTSMSGYQEILTDPSYVGQVVTMAAPEMGNVGTNPVDDESTRPHAVGMIVRSLSGAASNWRASETRDGAPRPDRVAGLHGHH